MADATSDTAFEVFQHSMNILSGSLTREQIEDFLNVVRNGPALSMSSSAPTPRVSKSRKYALSNNAATRPLNSWIAFRTYYCQIFKEFQQKEISGIIRDLWQVDPFKGKWTILAKAYSIIRDEQGRPSSPLDKFLQITCPYIGLIAPNEYLDSLGWEVVSNGHLKVAKRTTPPSQCHLSEMPTTSLSPANIVQLCKTVGYFHVDDSSFMDVTDSGAMVAGTTHPFATVNDLTEGEPAMTGSTASATGINFNHYPLSQNLEVQTDTMFMTGSRFPHNDQFHPDGCFFDLGFNPSAIDENDENAAFSLSRIAESPGGDVTKMLF